MKKYNIITVLSFICISLIFSSCTVQNRLYRPGYSLSWKDGKKCNETDANNIIASNIGRQDFLNNAETTLFEKSDQNNKEKNTSYLPGKAFIKKHNESGGYQSYFHAVNNIAGDSCDLIVMRNGDEIQALVRELTQTEVKYKRCDMPGGPMIVVNKSDVFFIKYANGAKEIFQQEVPASTTDQKYFERKTHTGGVIAFISSLVGLFIFGIPLGLLAVILGSLSVDKIKSHSDKYRGSAWGIIGIIIGAIDIIAVLIILSSM